MAEHERGIYEVCGCSFAEGNTLTARQVRAPRRPVPTVYAGLTKVIEILRTEVLAAPLFQRRSASNTPRKKIPTPFPANA
jgi:hypothetical protein